MPAWTMDNFIKSYSDSTFSTLLHTTLQALLPGGGGGVDSSLEVPPSLSEMHAHMMGVTKSTSAAAKNIMQRADEGSMLWDGPDAPAWVACHQRNRTCYGKISKSDWYSSRKTESCKGTFLQQVEAGLVNSTAVGLDICNLNGKTNELCQVRAFFISHTPVGSGSSHC
jgi:hypothetical protein